jgi:signal transduction histidine kinase
VLTGEISPDVRGLVDGDALRQALLNLLDNAVKYGPAGQHIRVGLSRLPDDRAMMWVEDEGPGVRPDRRERVWEPYFRLERHRESATAGSGIGLAVVRSVAEGHGGSARIEEARSGGARFVVEVSLASADGTRGARPAPGRGSHGRPSSGLGAVGARAEPSSARVGRS